MACALFFFFFSSGSTKSFASPTGPLDSRRPSRHSRAAARGLAALGEAVLAFYKLSNIGYFHQLAAWPNGKALDYDPVDHQEIAGSIPAVVITLFFVFLPS
ncbi:hypothetical protein IWZ00DRAFT_493026 [Phyllosticta capitalensis]